MGAWGVSGFANDTAADWSWEFKNADLETGLKLITDALNFRLTDHITYQQAAETIAIAAAEMVAAINGYPMDQEDAFSEDARKWIARTHPAADPDLTDLARRAVSRVTGPDSHIAGSWLDHAEPKWRVFIAALAAKLAG
jgi:hypothetical protein